MCYLHLYITCFNLYIYVNRVQDCIHPEIRPVARLDVHQSIPVKQYVDLTYDLDNFPPLPQPQTKQW
jgi:hypothetical protein